MMNVAAILAQASSGGMSRSEWFESGIGFAAMIFLLILAALWFIFPFMVYLKFNELIQKTKRSLEVLEEIERNTRKPIDGQTSSSAHYSISEPPSLGGAIFGAFAVVFFLVVVVVLVRRQ